MGSMISVASNESTKAEPLDIQTEYCNALRADNLDSDA